MNGIRSMIRKGDKFWYCDLQVEVIGFEDSYVRVKFLNDGREDTTLASSLETRQHPPATEGERPSWLSIVDNNNPNIQDD